MPVQTIWDDEEKTILRYIYEGKWTWNEVYASLEQAAILSSSLDHKFYSIVDMRQGKIVPGGAMEHIKRIIGMTATQPNNSGVTIFLEAQLFAKMLLETFQKVYPKAASPIDIIHTTTLEETHTLIRKIQDEQEHKK